MKKIVKKIIAAVALLLLTTMAGGLWLYIDLKRELRAPLNISQPKSLIITPGMSLAAIAHELQARGWLDHADYFILYGRRRDVAGLIKAGEYAIMPGDTPIALLDKLVSGEVVQHALTLIEGWTLVDIIRTVRTAPRLRRTLESYAPVAIMRAIGRPGQAAEGRFYPDTYYFPAGTTDVAFLARANARLEAVLQAEWQGRAAGLPYADADEALIMASIIEKETAAPAERAQIAGVFVRRLRQGMRLQADPTVIYALEHAAAGAFDGNLKARDLQFDSPYNSYRYGGLPPTPIASVGRAAIHAALHPATGDALYFVARGDGSHQFSATLGEHNAAVRKYQLSRP